MKCLYPPYMMTTMLQTLRSHCYGGLSPLSLNTDKMLPDDTETFASYYFVTVLPGLIQSGP